MPLKFARPTNFVLSSSTHHQQQPHISFLPSHMLFSTRIEPPKFPYSPPSSVLLSPLTECQGSPPSESDDFCSACKGAGEFVCCDNCTRVFHFLCCDPPLQEPPLGSFLCYECDARLKASETPAGVESFTLLGPLFKQLETTNTRSFALPSHIRDFYDNIAARDDGSYAEETKRFPL